MITDETAAAAFYALGNPARLSVLRQLVRAGCDGLNVGDLQRHLDMPPSTLAHHIKALVTSGIVNQEKNGREVINRADFVTLSTVMKYLTKEYCQDAAGSCR